MKISLFLLASAWLTTAAHAEPVGRCVVTDPTGTPLNVRAFPNGPIDGALHNGAIVRQEQTTLDERGRAWTYVVPLEEGRAGWVFRNYVSCY